MHPTLFLALALCLTSVPIATAEPIGIPVPSPEDGTSSTDCLYVDYSQSPPDVYWAPC